MVERLTYVNTHANLVAKHTSEVLGQVESIVNSQGAETACGKAIELIFRWCKKRVEDTSGPESVVEPRLDSFVIYLLRNGCSDVLMKAAILEQICLPGLENKSPQVAAVTKAAENQLAQLRKSRPADEDKLKRWHQAYHMFRLSAHCFVRGAELLTAEKNEDSLEFLTSAYSLSIRIINGPPMVS